MRLATYSHERSFNVYTLLIDCPLEWMAVASFLGHVPPS